MSNRRPGRRQIVVAFDARPDMADVSIRGGKGSYLSRMQALGLPVPPGFTIVTTAARAFMQEGRLPNRLSGQLRREIAALEQKTGKTFGDVQNPLIVSVRSGAEVSMPGMMETILNLGMSEEMVNASPIPFARDAWERFLSMYGKAVGEARSFVENSLRVPHDPWVQLEEAILAVMRSWDAPSAVTYRALHQIPDTLGTAVTVQAMVFGNANDKSGTGVVFSHDPNTGALGMYGEFLQNAQGEDLVAGVRTPSSISAVQEWNASVYQELAGHVAHLSDVLDAIVEIEFTVEDGRLFILQCRVAKTSVRAAATFAVHRVWKKRWTHERAVASLSAQQLSELQNLRREIAPADRQTARVAVQGLGASWGVAVGAVAHSSAVALRWHAEGTPVILVRQSTSVEDLDGMLVADGVVTAEGGVTCHAAVVMRGLGKPAVVGTSSLDGLVEGEVVTVCGTTGAVYRAVLPTIEPVHSKEMNLFLRWTHTFSEPRINFDAVNEGVCVNEILADVYILEGMAFAARGSALAYSITKLQKEVLTKTAELFACYLAIAVASELRHIHTCNITTREWGEAVQGLRDHFSLFSVVRDRGDPYILSILAEKTVASQVEFFHLATTVFDQGAWHSGYGGRKWGRIAEAAHGFLTGTLSHGVFVDRVFDLRHNGGTLFDKHAMVYNLTYEAIIPQQLNAKRDASSVSSLYETLSGLVTRLTSGPSEEVVRLFEEGKLKKLW